ncbi:hypothetical protein CYLTODRAFT_238785 [Cylindrobasidium torrendii FP15055 ss-10]|uniref:Uncharacterized protein n=1 Tax=Cylindrobasidium torrendii FP15055 ss-10 TaxID=1314674 RepID=A0A0D7BSV4_9AGAR|nr:hypothetical protein CYLTODRAFT_238785 [Cylindrobasidium torrendii FP15055 ss-10]
MTNLSAGVKRAHEDRDSNSGRKRQRDDSRDWKDTHLKNGPPRNKPGLGYDHRDRDRDRERDSRDRGRERHHRSRDRPRSRDRRETGKDGLKRQHEKLHQSHEDVEEGE